jgi:DNA repair protein RecO (recombination protein O)
MYITTKGLILRTADYKESSRMLTVLTESEGKISASAKGVRRKNSRLASGAQLYAYSELTFSKTAGRYNLTEASAIELFPGIGAGGLENLALAAYFAELLDSVCREEIQEGELLQLGLNAFYALSEGKKPRDILKGAFELRVMCLAGYAPPLSRCAVCGKPEPEQPALELDGEGLICASCAAASGRRTARLCPRSLAAMRYVASAEPKRVFSFSLDEDSAARFSLAGERYVSAQLERRFHTLDYYKEYSGI